jgi:hypothetical protein
LTQTHWVVSEPHFYIGLSSWVAPWHADGGLNDVDGSRPPVRAADACRCCAALAGLCSPVPVHLPANQKACARHRTRIGRAVQIELAGTADIVRACRRAWQLASRHGITRLVLAETTASQQLTSAPGRDAQ